MGLYADQIFPRLMDRGLGSAVHRRYREETLGEATGDVLEIGFGTGLNLAAYPEGVRHLVGVDATRMLEKRVRRRIEEAPFPVELLERDAADRLPFEDAAFDTVVSTWTLCSIDRVREALHELRRMLRPGGRFLFMEHGRSDRGFVAACQEAFNPIQNFMACGCNLNRRIDREIAGAAFSIVRLERFRVPGVPRMFAEVYRGAATPATASAPGA